MVKKKPKAMPFSSILKSKIKERSVTLRELSKASGVSESVIHGWIYGANPHDLNAVALIAQFFEMSLYELLFGRVDPAVLKSQSGDENQTPSFQLTDKQVLELLKTLVSRYEHIRQRSRMR